MNNSTGLCVAYWYFSFSPFENSISHIHMPSSLHFFSCKYSMAAAAINAASGGDENPIDAINRAQAFLSNLKASLETGQSAQV